MITERLNDWKIKTNMVGCEIDEDNFSIFFQDTALGKSILEMMSSLAYSLYEAEVCIEGLIEDMEELSGQKDKKAKKANR